MYKNSAAMEFLMSDHTTESFWPIVSVLALTIQAIRKMLAIIERMELNDGPGSYDQDQIKMLLDEAENHLQSLKT